MGVIKFEDFEKIDIRSGRILSAKINESAIKPAYSLSIDFGEEIGLKKSSAQLTENYSPEDLMGKQILAVVNFPPKQIGHFISEVLVLAVLNQNGKDAVLITTDQEREEGRRLL